MGKVCTIFTISVALHAPTRVRPPAVLRPAKTTLAERPEEVAVDVIIFDNADQVPAVYDVLNYLVPSGAGIVEAGPLCLPQ